jgi:hypothetical protein
MLGVAAGAVLLLGGGFFFDATKPLGANMARNWGCGFSAETRFIWWGFTASEFEDRDWDSESEVEVR